MSVRSLAVLAVAVLFTAVSTVTGNAPEDFVP